MNMTPSRFQVGDLVEFRVFRRAGAFTFHKGVVVAVEPSRFPGDPSVFRVRPNNNLGEYTPFRGQVVPFLEDELFRAAKDEP
jgi:hypothetical protein